MKTTHVVVLPYDPKWKDDFTAIQAELEAALGDLALGIEHVGSTSVEGMAAKPCIDVDVVIPDNSVLGEVIERLAVIGYFMKETSALRAGKHSAIRTNLICSCIIVCVSGQFQRAAPPSGISGISAPESGGGQTLQRGKGTGRAAFPGGYRRIYGI